MGALHCPEQSSMGMVWPMLLALRLCRERLLLGSGGMRLLEMAPQFADQLLCTGKCRPTALLLKTSCALARAALKLPARTQDALAGSAAKCPAAPYFRAAEVLATCCWPCLSCCTLLYKILLWQQPMFAVQPTGPEASVYFCSQCLDRTEKSLAGAVHSCLVRRQPGLILMGCSEFHAWEAGIQVLSKGMTCTVVGE